MSHKLYADSCHHFTNNPLTHLHTPARSADEDATSVTLSSDLHPSRSPPGRTFLRKEGAGTLETETKMCNVLQLSKPYFKAKIKVFVPPPEGTLVMLKSGKSSCGL